MPTRTYSQMGQALILIALAIVGILAMVGLAIDAGNAFSNRRKAQNAADTAALAAALAKANGDDVTTAALNRTASNSYTDGVNGATVAVFNPPGAGCNGTAGPYAGNSQYIQVIIHSTVDTYFAPIVGIDQLYNCVEAIARTQPTVTTSLALGSAVAAVSCTGYRTLKASGSTSVTLLGGGAFSNSNDAQALFVQKLSNLVTPVDKGLMAVGGIDYPSGYPSPITTGLQQFPCPLPDYIIPKYTCDYNYNNFPPASSDAHVTWSEGTATLTPGVYCISGSFPKSNVQSATTGGTGIGGTTIVILNDGFSWNGNVSINIISPTSGSTKGLAIYLPYGNTNTISLNGTAGMQILGSVFAPDADISLTGNFGNTAIESQWVGKTVDMSGAFNAIIQYNQSNSYEFPSPPVIEMTK